MRLFGDAVDEYDAGRPDHPAGVFDALEPLAGRRVLDVGAGTGIATRALVARGADVVGIDTDATLLTRGRRRSPAVCWVVADGVRLPVPDRSVDLVCFAQAWHWLDPDRRCEEVHRVLRPGGRWAAWWSHARADAEPWFDRYWSVLERRCPGTRRDQRDTDWGASVQPSGLFEVAPRHSVPWLREVTVDAWMTDQASHSYVVARSAPERAELLDELRAIVESRAQSGVLAIPYETWLWTAITR
jgi:SAM-dependent methyltransferase